MVSDRTQLETLGVQEDKNAWYLHFVAVRPEYQGQGVGKALVQYVTDIVSASKGCLKIGGLAGGTVLFTYLAKGTKCRHL